MLKIVIVEDEFYIRKGIVSFLDSFNKNTEVVGEFTTINRAVKMVEILQPNLVLLDIKLLDGNSFEFLEKTKHLNFYTIFITSYDNYAIRALKAGAVDYILKPIDIDELEAAIDKVFLLQNEAKLQSQITLQNQTITLNFINETQIIEVKNLLYCKSSKGYTTFFMLNGKKHVASKPLKEFEKKLTECQFIRAHQSYFVNTKFINKFDSKTRLIYLNDHITVPVSARKVSIINKFLDKK